jgi:transcriptional regulator with XRE-family HTH domain
MVVTPSQCRAARGLLDWSQQQLADAARVGVVTVRQFEGGGSQPRNATLDVLQRALEAAGVEFTNGGQPGVRLTANAEKNLRSGNANGYRYIGGVEFAMLDGERVAICRVSDEALRHLDRKAGDNYLATFAKKRATIERIAAQKFQASLMENDVIYVTYADVQSFLGR